MSTSYINTTVPSSDSTISYTPTSSWSVFIGPGGIGGVAEFDQGTSGFISYTFSQPATGLEYWGYQRSDGGLYSICFDCPGTTTAGTRIDGLNTSTNGSENPRLLYSVYNLTYAVHNVTIANLFDSRGTRGGSTNGAWGQMNIDRFVLVTPSTPPTSSAPGSSSTSGGAGSAPTSGTGSSGGSSSSNAGAIAGGVVGGLAALAIILLALWWFWWRKRSTRARQDMTNGEGGWAQKEPSFVDSSQQVVPFILSSPPQAPIGDGQMQQGAVGGMSPQQQGQQQYGSPVMGMAQMQQNVPPRMMPLQDVASPSGPSQSSSSGPSDYGGVRPLPVRSETLTSATSTSTARPLPSKAQRQTAADRAADPVSRPTESVASPSIYPSGSDYSSPTTMTAQTVSPRREQDAGFLQGDEEEEEEPETLPPDYHAATANPRR